MSMQFQWFVSGTRRTGKQPDLKPKLLLKQSRRRFRGTLKDRFQSWQPMEQFPSLVRRIWCKVQGHPMQENPICLGIPECTKACGELFDIESLCCHQRANMPQVKAAKIIVWEISIGVLHNLRECWLQCICENILWIWISCGRIPLNSLQSNLYSRLIMITHDCWALTTMNLKKFKSRETWSTVEFQRKFDMSLKKQGWGDYKHTRVKFYWWDKKNWSAIY